MTATSVTDLIRAEHDALRPVLKGVMERAAPGTNPDAGWVKAMGDQLKRLLDSHSVLEDEILFSKLDQTEPWVVHVTNEHVEIKKDLDNACAGSRKCLRHVADLCLGHFDEEEKWVLPAVDRKFTPLQLAIMGAQWAAARQAGR